jgi:hypothetical protein
MNNFKKKKQDVTLALLPLLCFALDLPAYFSSNLYILKGAGSTPWARDQLCCKATTRTRKKHGRAFRPVVGFETKIPALIGR